MVLRVDSQDFGLQSTVLSDERFVFSWIIRDSTRGGQQHLDLSIAILFRTWVQRNQDGPRFVVLPIFDVGMPGMIS